MTVRRVAVLGYHKIGVPPPPPKGWDSWFYVPEPTFVAQLSELRELGWEVVELARFLAGLQSPETLPERAALVTFDDGYRSMRTRALPCMQRLGVPGVLFVPTDHVGGVNLFDCGTEPEEPICDWDDLRVLRNHGISVQSHAASHRSFSTLSREEREAELVRSRRVLEQQIGERVETLAFPYGDPGPAEDRDQPRATGYRAAFGYRGGPIVLPVTDPYCIPRIAMGPDTKLTTELGDAN